MDDLYLKISNTKEKGQYLLLLENGDIFAKTINEITENYFVMGEEYIDKRNWKLFNKGVFIGNVLEIKPFNECISSNVDLEMAHRLTLLDQEINGYKLLSVSHHIHVWTIFDAIHIESKKYCQITVRGRGDIDDIYFPNPKKRNDFQDQEKDL